MNVATGHSVAELKSILAGLEALDYHQTYQQFYRFGPYPKQREFLDLGATKRERLLIAGNQNGKELRADCPVLTPDGWVAIGALKIGDLVMAGDGSVTEVTGVYPQGVKPLVEIQFCYGQSVVAGYDHLWKVLPPRARFKACPRFGKWEVTSTREMRGRYGDAPVPKYRYATPACGTAMLTPREVPVDPYVVGVLLGDGCLGQGLRFTTADVEIIHHVERELARVGGTLVRSKTHRYDFRIVHAPAMLAATRSLGLIGNGAAEKRVPPEYLWNAPEVRLAVLQGLMDTDGTCEKNGATTFTTICEGLAEDVMFLARSFGAKCYVRSRVTNYTHKGQKRAGKRSYTVAIRLPHVPLFRLQRKLSRYRRPVSTTDHNLIVSFRDATPAEAVCISVSHPDRTYVIKDFIVTHNTHTGAFEAACHMTGQYPAKGQVFYPDTPEMRAAGIAGKDAFPNGWQGRRFAKPTKGWIAGETSLVVRDVQQKKLCGEPGVEAAFGTGLIPKDLFVDKPSLARGITDAYDTIQVKHVSGGVSVARFKSYEQGRTKFQGESIDWGWADEEPPEDVYAEFLTRTVATGGMCFVTFTPLKGRSSVVSRFLDESSPDRGVVQMTIDDALHIPATERARIIAGFLPHEREARARGVPTLGSGKIFQVSEESITEPMIERVPEHWAKVWGLDFGIDHPFAAALLLFDRDNDVLHVHHVIRVRDQLPLQHAVPMKIIGAAVPVAWPHDGNVRGDRNTGDTMAVLYKKQGLNMMASHATWPDGGFSTEAGIMEMQERMATGRFKVAAHLSEFFEEFRMYHRKDGQIVKERDDILSAVRIGVMMRRLARTVPLGSAGPKRPGDTQAEGLDFDLF